MIDERKLDFWIAKRQNVLFSGRHGVGKTSMVTSAFDRANLHWLYFSAATMDPWVDFIGVPKEQTDDAGPYLDLVRPKAFRDDQIEALFFDEFNRSHKKVRNAVMELIQFKSINGRKFANLKVIWAAVNPADEDETYDVEKLDPAQEDRFHVKIELPYEPTKAYFHSAYGARIGDVAVEWWGQQTAAAKDVISPRRLDYAVSYYLMQGDVRDILPTSANVSALTERLHNVSVVSQLDAFEKELDSSNGNVDGVKQKIKDWLANSNNSSNTIDVLNGLSTQTATPKWVMILPLLPEEVFRSIYAGNNKVRTIVTQHLTEEFSDFLKQRAPTTELNNTGKSFHTEQDPATPAEWDTLLTTLESQIQSSNASYDRIQILSTIQYRMTHKMSKAQVHRTLKLMNQLARRCQNSTFKQNYRAAVPITNTLTHLNHKFTGERHIKRYAPVLVDRITTNFTNEIYTPPYTR